MFANQPPRLMRLPDVMAVTALCRDSVYRMAREGRFPKPIKIGDRASAWLEPEIQAWIERRAASRQA
jgi:prophage regulatory protein